MVFGPADGAEVIGGSMIVFAIGSEVPLEAGLGPCSNDDDSAIFPARHDGDTFLCGCERAITPAMPKPSADKALTRLGSRVSALWKGGTGTGCFATIVRFVAIG